MNKPVDKKIRTYSNNEITVKQYRERIIKNALIVFRKKGYEKTTMRDLGKTCNMSPANLYNYIGSKEDIIRLVSSTATNPNPYKQFVSELGNVTYTQALRECIIRWIQDCDRDTDTNLFLLREIYKFPSESRRILLGSHVDTGSAFEQLLRRGMEAGEFHVCDPTLLAHNILMYGLDWVLRKWFLKQHFTLEEYTRKQTTMIFDLITIKRSELPGIVQPESDVGLTVT